METGYIFDYDEDVEWVVQESEFEVPASDAGLPAALAVPEGATGIVIIATLHGQAWEDANQRQIVEGLQEVGLGTLSLTLVHPEEEEPDRATGEVSCDIGLLSQRLLAAVAWLRANPATADLKIGLLAEHLVAAAALVAAGSAPDDIAALALHNARPDLVREELAGVTAPALLVVSANDGLILQVNQDARMHLKGPRQLAAIQQEAGLLSQPSPLPQLGRLTRTWFGRYL